LLPDIDTSTRLSADRVAMKVEAGLFDPSLRSRSGTIIHPDGISAGRFRHRNHEDLDTRYLFEIKSAGRSTAAQPQEPGATYINNRAGRNARSYSCEVVNQENPRPSSKSSNGRRDHVRHARLANYSKRSSRTSLQGNGCAKKQAKLPRATAWQRRRRIVETRSSDAGERPLFQRATTAASDLFGLDCSRRRDRGRRHSF